MNIQVIKIQSNSFSVSVDGTNIGRILCYKNPSHLLNIYLSMDLSVYLPEISHALFSLLQDQIGSPMQVMLSSEETDMIKFLEQGGFRCMRRCFECEYSENNLAHPLHETFPLQSACSGSADYLACAELLFSQYRVKHEAINPLTDSFRAFQSKLPCFVIWHGNKNGIQHFAFVEENEIAYVGSREITKYPFFIESVVSHLFSKYRTIFFEADDNDREAMILKGLFRSTSSVSFNTYIR